MTTTQHGSTTNPLDLIGVGDLLDDEERLLRETVRRFVDNRVLPEVGNWFEQGTFPVELSKELGAMGLLSMHLEGYGCAGTSATAYGLACEELEAGDSGLRSFVSVQGSLAMFPIWPTAARNRSNSGCPAWPPGRPSGASA